MAAIFLKLLPFLCCLPLIIIFTSPASADNNAQKFHYFCDFNNTGNYTANSPYEINLNTVLSTLTSNTEIDYGFYNFSHGENTDKVNAIGFCRGDVKPNDCRKCLSGSRANLTQACPNRKEAIGWYEDEKCMLRYSDRSIFSHSETGPAYFVWSTLNATLEDQFNKAVKQLLDSLKSKAASGDSLRKYATETTTGPDNKTIYGLAQCTPDLSEPECASCLNESIKEVPRCCNNRIGARIIRPSCNLRFETSSQFYVPTADSPSPSPSPSPLPPSSSPPSSVNNTSSEDKDSTSRTAVAIVPLLLWLLCSFLFVSV